MDADRENLIANKFSLELCAKIAEEARNSDIKNFIQNILDANEIKDITITTPDTGKFKNITDIRFRVIFASEDLKRHKHVIVGFEAKVGDSNVSPYITTENNDYNLIRSTDLLAFKTMSFAIEAYKALPKLEQLVNSSLFQSYESDIHAYVDAGKKLTAFDAVQQQKRIADIALSFSVGMNIKIGEHGAIYPIIKASRKRLKFKTYDGRAPGSLWRKTIDRMECAQRVVSNEWHIVP